MNRKMCGREWRCCYVVYVTRLIVKSLVWRHNRNVQKFNSRMSLTQIRVLWDKSAISNNIWIGIVLSIPFSIHMKDKRYQPSMHCIDVTIRMVNLTLFVLIRHSLLRIDMWHLCWLYRREHLGQWLEIFPNSLKNITILYLFSGSRFIYSILN